MTCTISQKRTHSFLKPASYLLRPKALKTLVAFSGHFENFLSQRLVQTPPVHEETASFSLLACFSYFLGPQHVGANDGTVRCQRICKTSRKKSNARPEPLKSILLRQHNMFPEIDVCTYLCEMAGFMVALLVLCVSMDFMLYSPPTVCYFDRPNVTLDSLPCSCQLRLRASCSCLTVYTVCRVIPKPSG